MSKVKVPKKSIWVDMTAMCDMAFLLVTFFMLTSNFIPKELLQVTPPASVSETRPPEVNRISILVDSNGKVVLGIEDQEMREELLNRIAKAYKISFTQNQRSEFRRSNSVGVPVKVLSRLLNLPEADRSKPANVLGIPTDSTHNELKEWVRHARHTNPQLQIVIKADKNTPYSKIKQVLGTLQELNENKYMLITGREEAPTNPMSL